MNHSSSRGFSLVELAVTLVVIGLVLGFSVPAFQSYNRHQQLKGATENVAGQLRLLRETAIGIGQTQTMHFTANWLYNGQLSDYHIHNGLLPPGAMWRLPRDVTYYWGVGTNAVITSGTDGRMTSSGLIILQDTQGNRDTVSTLASGLVLTK